MPLHRFGEVRCQFFPKDFFSGFLYPAGLQATCIFTPIMLHLLLLLFIRNERSHSTSSMDMCDWCAAKVEQNKPYKLCIACCAV